jgi:thymidylate kinase
MLEVPTVVARARTGGARDRMEDRAIEFHRKVREGFLGLAREFTLHRQRTDLERYTIISEDERAEGRVWASVFSGNAISPIVVIDASAEPDAVFHQIKNEVERGLAFGPRS